VFPDGVRVKICGLRDASSARVAAAAGADALGFILAPSRRRIAPEVICDIRAELAATSNILPPLVGVVVNPSPDEIAVHIEISGVDMVQLSGDESPAILDEIAVPVIKALRFAAGTTIDAAQREVSAWLERPRPAAWLLVEGHAPGSYGGTGTVADWGLAEALAREFPIWLAGGLDPANVAGAIDQVRPVGVDVSSGVETEGVKDAGKIRAFVSNAQRSDSSPPSSRETA